MTPVPACTVSTDSNTPQSTTSTSPRRPQRRREVTNRYSPSEDPVQRTAARRNNLRRRRHSDIRGGLRNRNTGHLTLAGQRQQQRTTRTPSATNDSNQLPPDVAPRVETAPSAPAVTTANLSETGPNPSPASDNDTENSQSDPETLAQPSAQATTNTNATANQSNTRQNPYPSSDSETDSNQSVPESRAHGARHTRTLPREWAGVVREFTYSAESLRRETYRAVERSLILRANIRGAAHGRVPFLHVLEEVDRAIRELIAEDYRAGYQQRVQEGTANHHNHYN